MDFGIIWGVVGPLVGLAVSLGFAIVLVGAATTHGEIRFARWCFIGSAVLLGCTEMAWLYFTGKPLWWRATTGLLVGGAIFVGLPEALRWISHRLVLVPPMLATTKPEGATPAEKHDSALRESPPPSLLSLFMTDLQPSEGMTWNASVEITIRVGDREVIIPIFYNIYDDTNANAKYLAFYIPAIHIKGAQPSVHSYSIAEEIAEKYPQWIKDIQENRWAVIKSTGSSSSDSTKDIPFSGRIFIYHADDFSIEQLAALQKLFRKHGATVQFRGMDYATAAWTAIRAGDAKPPPSYVLKNGYPMREDQNSVATPQGAPGGPQAFRTVATQVLVARPAPNAAKPTMTVQGPAADQIAFVRQLTNLYIASHDGITPEMVAGLELPPEAWLNEQLEKQGKSWRVRRIKGAKFEVYGAQK